MILGIGVRLGPGAGVRHGLGVHLGAGVRHGHGAGEVPVGVLYGDILTEHGVLVETVL